MSQYNQDPIVSTHPRAPLAHRATQRLPLLPIAFLGACFIALESIFLRSQFQTSYFTTYSALDMAWYMATLFVVAFCFCVLMPRAFQVIFFILQFPMALFLFGSSRFLEEPATLGAIGFILKNNMLEEVFFKGLGPPITAVFFMLLVLKLACALLSPPYEAKKRLPPGSLLFMACCITLVPAQHSTLSVFSTTRSPTYKIMAAASIERHGYLFTWLAEAKSKTWTYCYLPPENLTNEGPL